MSSTCNLQPKSIVKIMRDITSLSLARDITIIAVTCIEIIKFRKRLVLVDAELTEVSIHVSKNGSVLFSKNAHKTGVQYCHPKPFAHHSVLFRSVLFCTFCRELRGLKRHSYSSEKATSLESLPPCSHICTLWHGYVRTSLNIATNAANPCNSKNQPGSIIINPRRACTARVTVLGSVCVSVCLLSHISPMERLFVPKTLSRTQRATKVKIFVGICLK